MSEVSKDFNSDDDFEQLGSQYRHKIPFNLKFFVKDVEISKRDFLLLFLIINSLVFLLMGQIGLNHIVLNRTVSDYYSWASIISGFLIGIVISRYIVDRIKRSLNFIKFTLILSLFITFIQVFLILTEIYLYLNLLLELLFFFNVLFLVIALIISCKFYLFKTNILERGRILAYLFVFTSLSIGVAISSALFNFMVIIPLIFVSITILYLHLNNEKYNVIFHRTKEKRNRKLKRETFKYYLFFLCFSLTAGLSTPFEGSLQFLSSMFGGNIVMIFVTVLIYVIIASILIGVTFDYLGRMAPLIYIILAIAIATYINIFRFTPDDLFFAVVISAYIAGIICVPLLIGDLEIRDNFGKSLSTSFGIVGIGTLIGTFIKISIPNLVADEFLAENIIMGTIFMGSIICLIFLLYWRETLPRKEQDWKEMLIHMYIIHNSGILLYNHAFIREEETETEVSSDLKAGGLIGVKKILKEILRGEHQIRTIDHGDRTLMFKTNNSNKVVFALVVKEELIVLRKKLDSLIEDFDKSYSEFIEDISKTGIDLRIFRPVKYLARKHFGK